MTGEGERWQVEGSNDRWRVGTEGGLVERSHRRWRGVMTGG